MLSFQERAAQAQVEIAAAWAKWGEAKKATIERYIAKHPQCVVQELTDDEWASVHKGLEWHLVRGLSKDDCRIVTNLKNRVPTIMVMLRLGQMVEMPLSQAQAPIPTPGKREHNFSDYDKTDQV